MRTSKRVVPTKGTSMIHPEVEIAKIYKTFLMTEPDDLTSMPKVELLIRKTLGIMLNDRAKARAQEVYP